MSLWIGRLVAGAAFLLVSALVQAVETELPFDSRSLVEVHTLDAIPKEVITRLGGQRGGPDEMAQRFDKFNATDASGSPLPRRRFQTAGVNSTALVIVYEQGGRPPTYHAVAFMMTPSGWSRLREWTFDEDEHPDLRDVLYTVDSARYQPYAQIYLRDKRRHRVEVRINQTRPSRRDGPLREINLSDNEVREIESVMSPIYPGFILNISGVVKGCPCEEGSACSDQVWVVPENDVKVPGVSLSRISGHWMVGPIQQWWMDRAALETDGHWTPAQRYRALASLWEKFPVCAQTKGAAQ
jgi:hypothetical protein